MKKPLAKQGYKNKHTYSSATALPQALIWWREKNGLKTEAAAAEMGVSTAAWGHWETGARFPQGKELIKLSSYTGLPVHMLLCPHAESCPHCDKTPRELSLPVVEIHLLNRAPLLV